MPQHEPLPRSASWHLDKTVPVSIIVAMVIQAGGGLWFVSKLDARIEYLERARSEQRDMDRAQDERLGAAVLIIREDVRDLNSKMDRLIEGQAQRRSGPP